MVVAKCNGNYVVPLFLQCGLYSATLSNEVLHFKWMFVNQNWQQRLFNWKQYTLLSTCSSCSTSQAWHYHEDTPQCVSAQVFLPSVCVSAWKDIERITSALSFSDCGCKRGPQQDPSWHWQHQNDSGWFPTEVSLVLLSHSISPPFTPTSSYCKLTFVDATASQLPWQKI